MNKEHKIFVGGIEAIGRSCILDSYDRVVFLEYAGDQVSAKSVAANFLANTPVMVESDEDGRAWRGRIKDRHYSAKTMPFPHARIPQASDGWLHGYVMLNLFQGDVMHEPGKKYELDWYPSDVYTRFGMLVPRTYCQIEVEDEFFRRLSWFQRGINDVKTPLHADWTHWLWNEFSDREWIDECTTVFGEWKAFVVRFSERDLQEMVETSLKARNSHLLSVFFNDAEEQEQYLSGKLELVTQPLPSPEEEGLSPEEVQDVMNLADLQETYGDVIAVVDDIQYTDFEGMRLTPGVVELVEERLKAWLIHRIAQYQEFETFKNEPFQVWTFQKEVLSQPPSDGAILPVSFDLGEQLMAEDGNGHCLFQKAFIDGDESLEGLHLNLEVPPYGHKLTSMLMDKDEYTLYVDGNVIMLPGEY